LVRPVGQTGKTVKIEKGKGKDLNGRKFPANMKSKGAKILLSTGRKKARALLQKGRTKAL